MLYVVMQALELMKTHVVKTTPDASLGEAIDLMDLYQVNGLPVVNEHQALCGMLTEADVARALGASTESMTELMPGSICPDAEADRVLKACQAACLLVRDYMSVPVISISEHAEAGLAARTLLKNRLKRMPVTDEQGRVVGMLNRVDVFQAIFEQLLETE